MAHNANETIIKTGGDVYLATLVEPPPAAADLATEATLEAAGWVQAGFIHEDGPTFEGFEGEKQTFNVWNVEAPARTRSTIGEPLVNVPFVQWNTDIVQLYFPGSTIDGVTGDVVIASSAGTPSEQSLLVVFKDGSNVAAFWAARTAARPGGPLEFPDDDFAQLPVAFDILANEEDAANMYRWIGLSEPESA